MKVLFFVPRIVNCGPVNVVLNIVKEISSIPTLSVSIISLRGEDKEPKDSYSLKFREAGIDSIIYLDKYPTPISKLLFLRKLAMSADVIHSHGFFPDLYSSLIPKEILKISTAHCIFTKDYQLTYGKFKGTILALLHHLVYFNTSFDYIIGCSDVVSGSLRKANILNKEKIFTIHNGVNARSFFKMESETKALNRENLHTNLRLSKSISSDEVYIYSGPLTKRKRVPELIQWFLGIPNNNKLLIILGDGADRKKCEEVAKTANNVLFFGFVDDPTPFYQIADYIVSNSSLEGFPMSILEGMSCGCKAILSDIPAHREVVKYFPNISMLFPADCKEQDSLNSLEKEFNYLSSERMGKEYLSLYKTKS